MTFCENIHQPVRAAATAARRAATETAAAAAATNNNIREWIFSLGFSLSLIQVAFLFTTSTWVGFYTKMHLLALVLSYGSVLCPVPFAGWLDD